MASSHPQPGALIGGKYRFVRLLGEGGMGAVYEAENTLTQKRVALKWMHPEVAKDPEASTRLIREAQASARVRHPNVVDVYDVGREGDAIFLVMEFLEGEPLSAMLGRGGMPIHQMISTLLPAMRGVPRRTGKGSCIGTSSPTTSFSRANMTAPYQSQRCWTSASRNWKRAVTNNFL